MRLMKLLVFLTLTAVLAACAGNGSGDDPAVAVETYLQAKVAGDGDTIQALLCSEQEQNLAREKQTFASVAEAHLEDMACTDAGNGRVTCEGKIVALYGTEETEFPLINYRAVNEDGEWKWCGETE